jgi:hypothetical protein
MPSTVRSRIGRLGSPTPSRQARTALELKEDTAGAGRAPQLHPIFDLFEFCFLHNTTATDEPCQLSQKL